MTKKPAQVFHFDLYGKRDKKYDFLNENSIQSIDWNTLQPNEPNYFLVSKNFDGVEEYEKGFHVNNLFKENNAGLVTSRDALVIQNSKEEVMNTIKDFANLKVEDARTKFNLGEDSRDWEINKAQKDLIENNLNPENIRPICIDRLILDFYFTQKNQRVLFHIQEMKY